MEAGFIFLSLFDGINIPDGCLVCDGSAVSRTDYAELFDVIGVSYGTGDGSSTFNLPDFSGRIPVGYYSGASLGASGGSETCTLSGSELASHSHSISAHTHENNIAATMPQLSHTIGQPEYKFNKVSGSLTANYTNQQFGAYRGVGSATAMTRSTNLAIADHPATACTMSGGVLDCAAFDTESAGLGQAHNNMMPYLALTYLIRYAPDGPKRERMLMYNGCMPVGPSGCYLKGVKS